MADILLTRRAVSDIRKIKSFSAKKWGKKVALEYLTHIEQSLNRLKKNPELLQHKTKFSDSLCFYPIQKHILVCSVLKNTILILTIKHQAMDLVHRLKELEPILFQEAKFFQKELLKKSK